MNAWPMLARCFKQQWKGYPKSLQDAMDLAWDVPMRNPGCYPVRKQEIIPLWYIARHEHLLTDVDILISIKYDRNEAEPT